MPEQGTKVVRDWFDAILQGNSDAMDRVMAPDYVHHDPQLPPDIQSSREAFKQGISGFISAFGDVRITVEEIFSTDDRVAARWTFSGTHQAEFMGAAATGNAVSFNAISTHRISGGKLAESWVNYDALGLMQQLGLIPGPG